MINEKIEYNTKSYVELFHLLFLEQLAPKLGQGRYALKGGCNLRFFFGSLRYSEDIDIDVHTVLPHTLKQQIDKILSGFSFLQILKSRNIRIIHFSAPKQTTTTQRWKIQIAIPIQSLPVNTKIEFSRRTLIAETTTNSIARELIVAYKLRSIFINHYNAVAALRQKIDALISRNEVQARDIFDIYHLIQTHKMDLSKMFTTRNLQIAIDNASSVTFSEFKSQVISYLEPAHQLQYDRPEIWKEIISTVCEILSREIV